MNDKYLNLTFEFYHCMKYESANSLVVGWMILYVSFCFELDFHLTDDVLPSATQIIIYRESDQLTFMCILMVFYVNEVRSPGVFLHAATTLSVL